MNHFSIFWTRILMMPILKKTCAHLWLYAIMHCSYCKICICWLHLFKQGFLFRRRRGRHRCKHVLKLTFPLFDIWIYIRQLSNGNPKKRWFTVFENHSKSLIATLTFKVKIFEFGTFAPKINVTILVIFKPENSNETF